MGWLVSFTLTGIEIAVIKKLFITEVRLHGKQHCKCIWLHKGSTEGQVKQGYSLAEQRAEIEKYCSSKSYNLIEIFKDEGISGAKANEDEMSIERDGLLDMLASLKENKIQYIVVLSTNRLWRSDLVKVLLHRELKKNNVDIRAIDRPNYSIYTQNPNEIFVNGMFELLDDSFI